MGNKTVRPNNRKKSNEQKLSPVEVLWVDSISDGIYWHDFEDGVETASIADMRQRTIGILVAKDEERIVIAQSISLAGDTDGNNLGGLLMIPSSAVLRIKKLK